MSASIQAPALSSLPSMPSVSPASARDARRARSSLTASASRNSALRPPRPGGALPRRWGSSPSSRRPKARRKAVLPAAPWRAAPAGDAGQDLGDLARLAFDRIAEDERDEPRLPRVRGGSIERHLRGREHDELVARRGADPPACGVSPASPAQISRRSIGDLIRYAPGWRARPRRSAAPATVGPEPMTAGSSPGTSEIR